MEEDGEEKERKRRGKRKEEKERVSELGGRLAPGTEGDRRLKVVIFNRGSAEPQGSASVCQGFRSWPVKITQRAKSLQTMS